MSSVTNKIFVCLRWLCLLVMLCINTKSCQGVERLCGRAIPDTLDLICVNGFARKTRKSIEPLDYYADEDVELPSLLDQLPFLTKAANNELAKTRRRRHGVYDECCRKPCSISELRSYCL